MQWVGRMFRLWNIHRILRRSALIPSVCNVNFFNVCHTEKFTSIIIQQVAQYFHIFLRPFYNYIIFFLQLPLLFQSSSINPLSPHQYSNPIRPGQFRSTSFSSSWWTPFHNFFWQSPLFHSLNMFIPLNFLGFNIV